MQWRNGPLQQAYLAAGVAGATAGAAGVAGAAALASWCLAFLAARLALRASCLAFISSCLAFLASALCSACFSFAASGAFAGAGAVAVAGAAGAAAGAWAKAPNVEITKAVAIRDCFNISSFSAWRTCHGYLTPAGLVPFTLRCVNLCKAVSALCRLAPELARRSDDGQVGEI